MFSSRAPPALGFVPMHKYCFDYETLSQQGGTGLLEVVLLVDRTVDLRAREKDISSSPGHLG